MILSILGPSGSGKDTQSKLLEKKLNIESISTGNLMRREIKKKNELGNLLNSYISRGKWVPDDIAYKLLKKEFNSKSADRDYIFNGYPRTKAQIFLLDELLEGRGLELDHVIHFVLDEEEVMNRLRKQEQGDQKRNDSVEEAMRQRIKSYKNTIRPVLEEYEKRKILINIDASPSIEEIHKDILSKISN